MECKCQEKALMTGQEAYIYSRQNYIKEIARAQGGWRYLLQCEICDTYWEMTWEGGGGFDYGVITLRRLSSKELKARWPHIEASNR